MHFPVAGNNRCSHGIFLKAICVPFGLFLSSSLKVHERHAIVPVIIGEGRMRRKDWPVSRANCRLTPLLPLLGHFVDTLRLLAIIESTIVQIA
jgi:hypothetical protein